MIKLSFLLIFIQKIAFLCILTANKKKKKKRHGPSGPKAGELHLLEKETHIVI